MLRVLGTFGLGIIFVAISPALRVSLASDAEKLQQTIVNYSPWSYLGIALGIIALLLVGLYRAAKPRT
jgi:uncharacterized BrkB/YihY/UPF0761 family membrane protein